MSMKRILVLAVAMLMLMSASAFAVGPYFVLENEGLTLAPALTLGVDWETVIGAVEGPSFGGDFSFGFDNILAPIRKNNKLNTVLDLVIDWGAVRCEFASLVVINPKLYPQKIEITDASSVEAKIIGVLDPLEVWGGVSFEYVEEAKWEPILFFGIEVHLDLD
jgi:hypothetical protein